MAAAEAVLPRHPSELEGGLAVRRRRRLLARPHAERLLLREVVEAERRRGGGVEGGAPRLIHPQLRRLVGVARDVGERACGVGELEARRLARHAQLHRLLRRAPHRPHALVAVDDEAVASHRVDDKLVVARVEARPHPKLLEPGKVVDALRRVGGEAERRRARVPGEVLASRVEVARRPPEQLQRLAVLEARRLEPGAQQDRRARRRRRRLQRDDRRLGVVLRLRGGRRRRRRRAVRRGVRRRRVRHRRRGRRLVPRRRSLAEARR